MSDVWAPRYRQAAFGAFLLKSDDASKALDLAYRDVLKAFDAFLAAQPAGKPLILAGHSQGALHLSRLLADRRDVLKDRLVAAYVVGWPLSATADLPMMNRTACAAPDETGCILSWQSFAEPANPALVMDAWIGTKAANGIVRQRRDMVCVNPLTGTAGGSAPPSANLGTLQPSADFATATVASGQVGARCDNGLLLVGVQFPTVGGFVLPGNNYHPFDYALFWGSIRADAARRLAAFAADDHRELRSTFARRLPTSGGRLLALDVGTKTIGLATCDAGWSFATAAETLIRTKFTADLATLRRFIADEWHRRPGGRPAAQHGRQRQSPHPVGPRLFPQPGTPRPAPPAVGRALVDRRGRTGDDRRRHEPRQARHQSRRPCRRAHPAGRDRRAGQSA